MGLVFDNKTGDAYEAWCRSVQSHAVDRSLEQLVRTLVDPKAGERVLDIGCGAGNHLLLFNKMGFDVSGIDASAHMIRRARDRLGHRCRLENGRAEHLPFDDNQFDVATLIHTLEFLDDPIRALKEAGRVAHRMVLVGVINSLSWNGTVARCLGSMGNPLFKRAGFFNILQIKSMMRSVYGDVPMSWMSLRCGSSFMDDADGPGRRTFTLTKSPFGCFLAVAATMTYRFKTDNLPLKLRMKKAADPLVGAGSVET